MKTARDIETEEKQAFMAKQLELYHQKRKMLVLIYCFLRKIMSFMISEKKMILR